MKFVIAGYHVPTLARKTLAELIEDNLLAMSAASAYSFFFALFPTVLLAAPILSLFGNKQQLFNRLFDWMAPVLPASAFDLVQSVLRDVIFAKNAPDLISVGALLALFAGANMFSTLAGALNAAYEVSESRPWWRVELIAIGATIVSVITIGAALALLMGGDALLHLVAQWLHLGPSAVATAAIAQYVLMFVLVVGSIWAMYMLLPNVKAQGKLETLVGAIAATLLWVIITTAFRLYVTHFGTYNRTYGTVGAVIVLLMWMYLSMLAILVGGELNSELRKGTASSGSRKDSESGGNQGYPARLRVVPAPTPLHGSVD